MSISVQCPGCEKKLKTRDELAGKRVKCPGCGRLLVVPLVGSRSLTPSTPPALPMKSPRQRRDNLTVSPGPKRRRRWPWYVGAAAALSTVAVMVYLFALPGNVRSPAKSDIPAVSPAVQKPETKRESQPEREPDPQEVQKPKPEPGPIAERKPQPKPKPGGQVAAPLLSGVTVASATIDPVVITFTVQLDTVQGTLPFEKKAGLWFCFGTPSTLPSLRAELEKALKEDGNRFFLNMRGPGFVAAQCSGIKQDPDQPDAWTGQINLGKATIRGDQIEIPSAFGPTYYKVTEMPISWVYFDGEHRLSNELKAIVDLKTSKVVKTIEESKKG